MIRLTDHDGEPALFSQLLRVIKISPEIREALKVKKFKAIPNSVVTDFVGNFMVVETVEEIENILKFGHRDDD